MSFANGYTPNQANAGKADTGAFFKQSGVLQNANIDECVYGKKDSGAEYFKFNFSSASGNAKYCDLYVTKKDGTRSFNADKIDALMFILGQQGLQFQDIPPHENDGKFEKRVTNFINQKLPVALQLEEYIPTAGKNKGIKQSRHNIQHFFYPNGQTYSEAAESKPAETINNDIESILLPDPSGAGNFGPSNFGGGQQPQGQQFSFGGGQQQQQQQQQQQAPPQQQQFNQNQPLPWGPGQSSQQPQQQQQQQNPPPQQQFAQQQQQQPPSGNNGFQGGSGQGPGYDQAFGEPPSPAWLKR